MYSLFTKKISTRNDAVALIDAAVEMFPDLKDLDSTGLQALKDRIADAEYNVANGSSGGVDQDRIAVAFNYILQRMHAPDELRVTSQQMSSYRKLISQVHPEFVPSKPEGGISPLCRPVEALYLLFLLDFNGGLPVGIEQASVSDAAPPNRGDRSVAVGVDASPPNGWPEQAARRKTYSRVRASFAQSLTASEQLSFFGAVLDALQL